MTTATPNTELSKGPPAGFWRPGLMLVLGVTLARVVFILWLSPYTLAEDEAHYWDWSRHVGWSYYSKGPGVAWAIALSTAIFGHAEWAVRLPSVIAGAIGALAAGGLARDAFGNARAGVYACAAYLLIPAFQALALLMTIDGPYLACWMLACWGAYRGITTGSGRAWVFAALAFAVGFWFKYTILFLLPGVVLAWALARRSAMVPRRPIRLSVALGVIAAAVVGLGPVLMWNAEHEWVTVRHLLGHLGVSGGDLPESHHRDAWTPVWALEYLVLLPALIGPIFALFITECVDLRRERDHDLAGVVLVSFAAPLLLGYLAVSLVTQIEGNWALAGSVTLVPLAGHAVVRVRERLAGLGRVTFRTRPLPSHLWRAGIIVGVVFALATARLDLLSRLPVVGTALPAERVTGLREHARGVEREVAALREQTGLEPFVMSEHYGRTGQLAFYLEGRPVVYCAQAHLDGRRTQYDMWAHTDLMNRETHLSLTARPAVLLGGTLERWSLAFESVTEIGRIEPEPKDNRSAFIGIGYVGFPSPGSPANDPRIAPGFEGNFDGGMEGGSDGSPHGADLNQADPNQAGPHRAVPGGVSPDDDADGEGP